MTNNDSIIDADGYVRPFVVNTKMGVDAYANTLQGVAPNHRREHRRHRRHFEGSRIDCRDVAEHEPQRQVTP